MFKKVGSDLRRKWDLRIPQIPYLSDNFFYDEDEKVNVMGLAAHRRMGKSTGGGIRLNKSIKACLAETEIFKIQGDIDSAYPNFAFVAPTKVQARRIIWDIFKDAFAEFRGLRANNSTLVCEIPRPHLGDHISVHLLASKYHDRIRGMRFRGVLMDEFQDSPEDSLSSSILPSLKELMGWLIFQGTAKGQDHFYKLLKHYLALGAPTYIFPIDKTFIMDAATIEAIRRECLPGVFEREYGMDFTASLPGTFYHSIIEDLKKDPNFYTASEDESLSKYLGVDIGVGEGFAAWLTSVDPDNHLIHVREFYTGYDNLGELRIDLEEDGLLPDVIMLPHDAEQRKVGAYRTTKNKDIFREVFPECLLMPVSKTPNLMSEIENVQRHLPNIRMPSLEGDFFKKKNGRSDAHQGLRLVGEYARKKDKTTGVFMDAIDKSTGVDHAADALRTLISGLKMRDGKIQRFRDYKIDRVVKSGKIDFGRPYLHTVKGSHYMRTPYFGEGGILYGHG